MRVFHPTDLVPLLQLSCGLYFKGHNISEHIAHCSFIKQSTLGLPLQIQDQSEANSLQIETNQTGIHSNLEKIIKRHLATDFKRPVSTVSKNVISLIQTELNNNFKQLIIDTGCGTGQSTKVLKEKYSDCLVVATDKSIKRLGFHKKQEYLIESNSLTLRTDINDLIIEVAKQKWPVKKHYILYPNPWPKSIHLKRRIYAHPSFASLISLKGELEVRSNWKLFSRRVQTISFHRRISDKVNRIQNQISDHCI